MADPETKKVYVTQTDGKIIDAATGAAVASIPDSAAAVRLNNKLRRHVEAALGSLTLQSPDPAKRIQAAQSVFKTHDETMLPAIDSALQKETNKSAKLAFTEARAAILLFKEDATDAEKLEAIATIKARGDQEALALLTGLTGDQPPAIAQGRGQCDRGDPEQPGALVHRAERLVRAVARLGAAARGHRPCHHLRGDGRHQHGPWRDGHDRGLCHLRGAGNHPHQFPRAVRLFAADRRAAGLHRRRRDRHPDRAQHHSLSLRPSAGNAAGDLGPVAGFAAGGAHHVRSHQPGGRQSLLDERRVRDRSDHDHLQPAVDSVLHAGGVRHPAGDAALHQSRA